MKKIKQIYQKYFGLTEKEKELIKINSISNNELVNKMNLLTNQERTFYTYSEILNYILSKI